MMTPVYGSRAARLGLRKNAGLAPFSSTKPTFSPRGTKLTTVGKSPQDTNVFTIPEEFP